MLRKSKESLLHDHKRHFLSIKYINRGIDLVNLSSIFNDTTVQNLILPYFDNIEPPIISYSYKRSSRNIIFNYTSITSDVSIEENTPTTWDCDISKFRYGPCGHIVTGDLNIVEDREVINFLRKGPKYRPSSKIDWNECRQVIHDALSSYCKKWCKRENADKKSLDAFLNKCKSIVNIRIAHLKNNLENTNRVSSISRIKAKLQKLGTRFVFVPADKAANNVVVVCRKYYMEVLKKEIFYSSTFPNQQTHYFYR